MSEALHILQHSLGLDQYGQGRQYRNHFVTGKGSTDYPHCMQLVKSGLMTRRAGNEISGGSDIFSVTEAGKQYVKANSPKPPKLTRSQQRYRDWLRSDDDLTFGEWLKQLGAPKEDPECWTCRGTGLGQYDGTRCHSCKGTGVDRPQEEWYE